MQVSIPYELHIYVHTSIAQYRPKNIWLFFYWNNALKKKIGTKMYGDKKMYWFNTVVTAHTTYWKRIIQNTDEVYNEIWKK